MLLLTKDLFSDSYLENILAFLIYAHCVRTRIPAQYKVSPSTAWELYPPAEVQVQVNSNVAHGECCGSSAEIREARPPIWGSSEPSAGNFMGQAVDVGNLTKPPREISWARPLSSGIQGRRGGNVSWAGCQLGEFVEPRRDMFMGQACDLRNLAGPRRKFFGPGRRSDEYSGASAGNFDGPGRRSRECSEPSAGFFMGQGTDLGSRARPT